MEEDYRKRHIAYPTFILSLGVTGEKNWFEIRTGVEEENTPKLCEHARRFLEQVKINIDECLIRLQQMGAGWSLIHGDRKKDERKTVAVENLSRDTFLMIVDQYLKSGEIADIHISRKYYLGDDRILNAPCELIDSLAGDLNSLNYFFELAHFNS